MTWLQLGNLNGSLSPHFIIMENYIEIYLDENGEERVRGQLSVLNPDGKPNPNAIIGIAKEDGKKRELVELTL